jgi:small ubiquitin-related modifier
MEPNDSIQSSYRDQLQKADVEIQTSAEEISHVGAELRRLYQRLQELLDSRNQCIEAVPAAPVSPEAAEKMADELKRISRDIDDLNDEIRSKSDEMNHLRSSNNQRKELRDICRKKLSGNAAAPLDDSPAGAGTGVGAGAGASAGAAISETAAASLARVEAGGGGDRNDAAAAASSSSRKRSLSPTGDSNDTSGQGDSKAIKTGSTPRQAPPPPPPLPEDTIVLKICSSGRGNIAFKVKRDTPFEKVFNAFADSIGIPVTSLRFIFDNIQLGGHLTPGVLEMENGDIIGANLEQVGDIGIWRSTKNVHPLLMASGPLPVRAAATADLRSLVATLTSGRREDTKDTTFLAAELPQALSPSLCAALCEEVDKRYSSDIDAAVADYKWDLTFDELCGHVGHNAAAHLSSLMGDDYDRIVVRRCEPQDQGQGRCIDFHLDQSRRILQVALVGEEQYEGGRLVFATSDGVLHAPRRQAGAVTVHNSSVVPGVTRHVRGVRYGLFFIKE